MRHGVVPQKIRGEIKICSTSSIGKHPEPLSEYSMAIVHLSTADLWARLKRRYGLAKHLAPMLVVAELIKAGASGRKQDYIARHCLQDGFARCF